MGSRPSPQSCKLELFAEDKPAHFISQLLYLLGIARGSEPFCELKEFPFILLRSLDTLLDQLHEHAVIAESATLRNRLNLLGDSRRQ